MHSSAPLDKENFLENINPNVTKSTKSHVNISNLFSYDIFKQEFL
jgi:hypothetical protein